MNEKKGRDFVVTLYYKIFGEDSSFIQPVTGTGSARQYFRLGNDNRTVIAVYNEDKKENNAFLSFTRTFQQQGLPVPEIFAESPDGLGYLLQDLGDTTLFNFLQEKRRSGKPIFPMDAISYYRKTLTWLPKFQIHSKPDYGVCYPRPLFDRQSMMWDLNYFKYYYLKLAGIPFDEQSLENDFLAFTSFLLEVPSGYFLYRDFQSRNIMIYEEETWFIDYQGGRRGPLQYDVASLLYDAKADIPEATRRELLEFYLDSVADIIPIDRDNFLKYYPGFVLIRILQAMGAYGFRGYYEKKPHFLQSIPFALRNLAGLIDQPFLKSFPELKQVIGRMLVKPYETGQSMSRINAEKNLPDAGTHGLHVLINSFSYKKGIPEDPTHHGGGFVFDCRALPNPGRYEKFQKVTGKDQEVIDFLKQEPALESFLENVYSLVDQSIRNYLKRNFDHLMVSFGCTGGQHRSVFCAEALARYLKDKYPVEIELHHREQENKPGAEI